MSSRSENDIRMLAQFDTYVMPKRLQNHFDALSAYELERLHEIRIASYDDNRSYQIS